MQQITRTHSDNPDFQKLTDLLDDELCRIYNTKKEDFEDYNRITGLPTVILVYEKGQPIACGCFRIFDAQTVELKRMFVLPEFRGSGIATSMVRELEEWAIELGYQYAVLETGKGQPAAIAMYEKLGYQFTEHFSPEDSLQISVCMKKALC
jgi:GNAT superfamily N-acetyltransferase